MRILMGKPCKKCGTTNKYTDGRCKLCHRSYRMNNKERIAEYSAEYHANNKNHRACYRADNKEHIARRSAEYDAKYRKANLEKLKANNASWCKANPDRRSATESKYRAAKLQAIPSWGNTWLEKLKVAEFYLIAKTRSIVEGRLFHVDHMVPLQNDRVQGLHCSANLQILEGSENSSKSNRYWPDMP